MDSYRHECTLIWGCPSISRKVQTAVIFLCKCKFFFIDLFLKKKKTDLKHISDTFFHSIKHYMDIAGDGSGQWDLVMGAPGFHQSMEGWIFNDLHTSHALCHPSNTLNPATHCKLDFPLLFLSTNLVSI